MQNLSKKIENLPSLQPEALREIIKGLYQPELRLRKEIKVPLALR
jgi:hypothetical protein